MTKMMTCVFCNRKEPVNLPVYIKLKKTKKYGYVCNDCHNGDGPKGDIKRLVC